MFSRIRRWVRRCRRKPETGPRYRIRVWARDRRRPQIRLLCCDEYIDQLATLQLFHGKPTCVGTFEIEIVSESDG